MRLTQNIALHHLQDRVTVIQSIVGPANRYRQVRQADNTGAGYFIPDPNGVYSEAVSLDHLCRDKKPSLIKIDVEGMELQVLDSGSNFLGEDKPILYIEVSAEQLERSHSSIQDLENWLLKNEYSLFRNEGSRNSINDEYRVVALTSLTDGGSLFDCLAVPNALVPELQATGKLPPISSHP